MIITDIESEFIRVETLYCKHTGQSANLQWLHSVHVKIFKELHIYMIFIHRYYKNITATKTVGL